MTLTHFDIGCYSDDVKYVLNAHGDVVALLNANGTVTKRYEYDAFGNELSIDNTDMNPFRYCAEHFDTETGTIYLRARYYSPVTGRFTQLDPIRNGLNWYAYCLNNPILFVDSTGWAESFVDIIVEKNSGTIEAVQVNANGTVETHYFITLNGITKYYTTDDYRFINDKAVMDTNRLSKDFNMPLDSVYNMPGDKLDSVDEAALAWSITYGEGSVKHDRELAASIYYYEGKYSYNVARMGGASGVTIPTNIPVGAERVAIIHSHAAYAKGYLNEKYSDTDFDTALHVALPSYLVTLGGTLQVLYLFPVYKKYIISDQVYKDPNSP